MAKSFNLTAQLILKGPRGLKPAVDKIRNDSKAKTCIPWTKYYSEMMRKTMLRRLCKMLPMNTDDYRFIVEDERDEYKARDVEVTDHNDPLAAGQHGKPRTMPDFNREEKEGEKDGTKPVSDNS